MSWKNIGFVALAVVGVGTISNLAKSNSGSGMSANTYDAGVAAEFKELSSQLPKKMMIQGEPAVLLSLKLDGRAVTLALQFEDEDWNLVDADSWAVARAGAVGRLCAGGTTRNALEHGYSIVYRYHDATGKFRGEMRAIAIADCKNAA